MRLLSGFGGVKRCVPLFEIFYISYLLLLIDVQPAAFSSARALKHYSKHSAIFRSCAVASHRGPAT